MPLYVMVTLDAHIYTNKLHNSSIILGDEITGAVTDEIAMIDEIIVPVFVATTLRPGLAFLWVSHLCSNSSTSPAG